MQMSILINPEDFNVDEHLCEKLEEYQKRLKKKEAMEILWLSNLKCWCMRFAPPLVIHSFTIEPKYCPFCGEDLEEIRSLQLRALRINEQERLSKL